MPGPAASHFPAPPATRHAARGRARFALPVIVLLAGAALSAWMFLLLRRDADRREQAFLSERITEAQAAIEVRMTHYVDALYGGASFFAATPRLDREMWRVYTNTLQLRERYPGINGLGIILVVPPGEVPAWQAQAREAGMPAPEVKPFPGTKSGPATDVNYLITLVESPPDDRPPIGRNIATEPSRRHAAELARDTGEPHIHQRIPGSRDTQRRSGLLLYVPLYRRGQPLDTVAQRRAAHIGWVYAQVFPEVFLEGVLGLMRDTLRLHFFEAGGLKPDRLLYASGDEQHAKTPAPLPEFERVTQITLAGEQFQLGWRRGPAFPVPGRAAARWVAGSLGVATLLLAGLIASLQSTGLRANQIAAARTAELTASEERFRQAFDFAGIGMALIAPDGRILGVNQSLAEILGYPAPRLLQKKFSDLTHPADAAADLALREELLAGQRRFYQLEKRVLHRDGHSVWVRVTASLVRDAAGEPLHVIAQVEDITDRRRLEASLATARDRALEDSRIKSEFLATMVHEIRSPANQVIGATMRLRNQLAGAEPAESVRALERSGDTFLQVLNDILDYSTLEFGQIALEVAPFHLRECVQEAVAGFADLAREKQLKLEAVIASGAPETVAGDSKRLRQVLGNLLAQAIKCTDAGEIRISVTAEALDAATGRQRLKFAVRDTGSGLASGVSFQRGGSAVGLAISKRLTELMEGTLWTESEPGRGTTFHFTISVEPRGMARGAT